MGAIFISYTGRDAEGVTWADRLVGWLKEWDYGFFRDQDPSNGITPGDDWRARLNRELGQAQALISLCTSHYDTSPWCVAEVAVALERGKTLIPIQLGVDSLPPLLRDRQAIVVAKGQASAGGSEPSTELLAAVKAQLRQTLRRQLHWRALQRWDGSQPPYPGLPAFTAAQAPVFFGRDGAINRVRERLESLAKRAPAFLLLLGASGYGKSSLVRAGVVPRLASDPSLGWLVLEPFSPGLFPFAALHRVLRQPLAAAEGTPPPVTAGADGEAAQLVRQLHWLRSVRQGPLLLVIDQFEELLSEPSGQGGQPSEGARFLAFLQSLLSAPVAGVMLLATMRTDYLDPLQTSWPDLVGQASTEPLRPIRQEDFGELITGPAERSGLRLQPGLAERLVSESGGRDALPLLAFTLEKLWRKRRRRGVAVAGPNGARWDLTVDDYDALDGVAGAVRSQAALCWNPDTSGAADKEALRQAFLDHLVTLSDDGRAAKRPARLEDLPQRSQPILRRFVEDRLLVSDAGMVEIAHEALLRTWAPLQDWLDQGREELEQRRRVRRLCDDLKAEGRQPQRRLALERLAALAAGGDSEGRAVRTEAAASLAALLPNPALADADRQDAALVLALIGTHEQEAPLRELLADGAAPVAVRRRAAESLGLLAQRCGDGEQRRRIERELERWLRSEPLNLLVTNETGWAEHDARLPLLQGAARGLQLAASAELPLWGSGPGRLLPMLALMATQEQGGLRIRTEVVEVPLWRLPLPGGERLELVTVPAGEVQLGSPPTEGDREDVMNWFAANCDGCKGVDVEARRRVRLGSYAMVRQPISQAQWRGVVKAVAPMEGDLDSEPGKANPESLWDQHAQPRAMAVDSVSWNDCQEWLRRLNRWLLEKWGELGGSGEAPQLALPSESQWEAACRAGTDTPFHFGATLDANWARYDATSTYGPARKGGRVKQPGVNGAHGLVNRWGLAEMHGQVFEWCADSWHPDPIGPGWPEDGQPWHSEDAVLVERDSGQKSWKLLRGGSWISDPISARAAMRFGSSPDNGHTNVGVRPVCFPPRIAS